MPTEEFKARNERNTPTSLPCRIAQDADAEALAKLINAAFVVERPIFDGDRTSAEGVRTYMSKGTFLMAFEADALVGCVYAEVRGTTGYIGLLSVEPSRQGTGLGRKLMKSVEEFFRRAGCHEAELRVVSARAPLPSFYKHLGYSESRTEAITTGATPKIPCHFLYMKKSLASSERP